MDALKLLKKQHDEVDALFTQFEKAGDGAAKKRMLLVRKISDELAIHATIEEKIFYPATKDAQTEDMLREAVEEHLSVKRIIADLIETSAGDAQLEAKVSVLKEQVQHHVKEEEKELFPKVKKLLDSKELEALGARMEKMAAELRSQGDARMSVPGETDSAAPV